jgi:hypothetical protein
MALFSAFPRQRQAELHAPSDINALERVGADAMAAWADNYRSGLDHSPLPAIAGPRRQSRRAPRPDDDLVQLNVLVPRAVRNALKAEAGRRGVGLGVLVSGVLGRFCQRQRQ